MNAPDLPGMGGRGRVRCQAAAWRGVRPPAARTRRPLEKIVFSKAIAVQAVAVLEVRNRGVGVS